MEDRLAALKAAKIAVHELEISAHLGEVAVLRLDEPDADVTALTKAEEGICLAARDLYRAIEALPPERRPKGWHQ
jgi:hypothetical protein